MNTEVRSYFADPHIAEAFRAFITKLPTASDQESTRSFEDIVALHTRTMVNIFVSNAAQVDRDCAQNIAWIGDTFVTAARNYKPSTAQSRAQLFDLFADAYRFLCELDLCMASEISFELRRVRAFVSEHFTDFPDDVRSHLVYANFEMPSQLLKKLVNHPDIAMMRQLVASQNAFVAAREQWNAELAIKEGTVNNLRQSLGQLESGYNFVGLVHGFQRLATTKTSEKRAAFWSLLALALLILTPLVVELGLLWYHKEAVDTLKNVLLFSAPPLIAIEIAGIYFFRVVLGHFRSLKAQLLQIDLRTSLCQFIESYATYSVRVKKDDAAALAKFENIVFSGLQANEEKLPSTFDGLDQLAALVKSIRGS